jgi:pyruvate/2-oxoglutarate dehydrogenase complex dihydrolipoamide acyltransferase (E2) component
LNLRPDFFYTDGNQGCLRESCEFCLRRGRGKLKNRTEGVHLTMKSIKYTGFRRTISEYTKLASRMPVIHETTQIRIKGLKSFCKKNGVTLTPVIMKVLASVQKENPIINSFIARNIFLRKKIYFPDEVDMAVAIEMHEFDCHFSTFAVFRHINRKSIFDIRNEINNIRDLPYNKMPLSWLTSILDRCPDFVKSMGLKMVSQVPVLRKYIFGTMGFSSLGKYGLKNFDTLFNLTFGYGIGGIEDKVVIENGTPEVVPVLNITQTSDHCIVDGAEAARILSEIKRIFESGEYTAICGMESEKALGKSGDANRLKN